MPKQSLNDLIRVVHKLAGQSEGTLADAELLARFVEKRDEAAFEALVWRHGQLIWNVCHRILRNRQDAEDAFQATFLVMARRAASIRERRALGGWLYQIAQRICLGIRKKKGAAATLPLVEQPVAEGVDATEQADLRRLLEEEIGRLPRKYRLPLVLRYLEGRSTEEAAAIVGCPRGTILSRLAWSRQRLRSRLAARGIGLSIALAAAAATESSAAPSKVVLTAASAGLLFAANSAMRNGRSVVLARGVLRAMLMTKIVSGSVGALIVLTASVGLGMAVLPPLGGANTDPQQGRQASESQRPRPGREAAAPTTPDDARFQEPPVQKSPDEKLPRATFVKPVSREIPDTYLFTGRTEASRSVDIRPRLAGTLTKILVKPGSQVKEGDVLFELDPAQLQAEVDKAAAEVRRAEAQTRQADLQVANVEKLVKEHVTSEREANLIKAKLVEAQSSLESAKATYQEHQLRLQMTRIVAPFDGRVGRISLDVGSPVDQNSVLTTLVAVKPIVVAFNVSESVFVRIQKYLPDAGGPPLHVEFALPNNPTSWQAGKLESVDNQFDPRTGTITARASFTNASGLILPGMSTQIRVVAPERKNRLMIPQSAYQKEPNRGVWVLSEDNELHQRQVGFEGGEGEMLFVTSGLKPTDRVVLSVDPPAGLKPGTRVSPTETKPKE